MHTRNRMNTITLFLWPTVVMELTRSSSRRVNLDSLLRAPTVQTPSDRLELLPTRQSHPTRSLVSAPTAQTPIDRLPQLHP